MRKISSIAAAAAVVATCLGARSLHAQQPADSTARRQQRALDSLAAIVREMQLRLDSLAKAGIEAAQSQPPASAQPVRSSGSYMNIGFDGLADAGWSSRPDVTTLQLGDHDPKVRGFTIPNGEMALDAVVDPYFKGFSNIVLKLDKNGETGIELEEMFALTTSLPHNLQLKAGQFFAEFGRQNSQHPHAWSFVDEPLVLARMFGAEGLRSQGARVSWLLPTSTYAEAMFSVLNSAGGTTSSFRSDESADIHLGQPIGREVRGVKDLLIVPRLQSSIELSDTQTLLWGVSAALGPNNSGPDASTAVYGADVYWKWKSATAAAGFPFLSLQAEALARRYDAAARLQIDDPSVTLPAETLKDQGMYAQLLWGIRPRIVAGLRGDFVTGTPAAFTADSRVDRTRISPNFTWYPTEFSKFRLQYNFDDRKGLGQDHSLWLQFEFIMGAHAAHKF